MKKITFLLIVFFTFASNSYSQVSSYAFSSNIGTYTETSASATPLPLVRADTYLSVTQPIGFTFNYAGVDYTQFKMSSNGFISLNTTGTSSLTSNDLSTANTTSRPIIAPLWDDLDGGTPASSIAAYEVTGTAPNRVLTVEWRNWEWNWNSATPVISFQVKLYETTNVIDFVYRQEATAVNTGSASIGLGSATGSGVGSYLNVTSVSAPAVSSTTSVINIAAKPANNQVFTFTPPAACTGTPVAGTASPVSQTLVAGQTPAALTVTGQTTGVSGLTFQWQESADGSTGWVNAVGGTGVTTLSYTPPAYSGTPIFYRLVITCTASGNSANSSNAALVSCTALTAPTTAETFNTFLPSCWSKPVGALTTSSTLTGNSTAWLAEAGFANTGTNPAVRINAYGGTTTIPDNDWLISPAIDLGATAGLYRVKYKMAVTSYLGTTAQTTLGTHVVRVVVSTDGGATWSDTNVIKTYTGAGTYSNTGSVETALLTGYTGVVKIGFLVTTSSTTPDLDVHIDDFVVEPIPSCLAPTALTVSGITNTSANISWTSANTDFEYVIQAVGTGVPTVNGTANTGATVTAMSLSANTAYEVYVRSNCTAGGNGYSSWTGPVNFYTGYCIPSSTGTATYVDNFTTSGGSTNISNLSSGFTTGGYLDASAQSVTSYATSSFNFSAEIVGGTAGFSVWIDWNNDLIFDNATEKVFNTTSYGSGPFTGTISIPAAATLGNYRMRITTDWNVSNPSLPCAATSRAEFEDYTITVTAAPACAPPSVFTTTAINASGATISWTQVASETNFQYVVQTPGTGVPTGGGTDVTGATFVALSGLSANTAYEVYVRTNCGSSTFSTWAGPVNFTTACNATNVPYTMDFEGATVPALPNCTSQENVGLGNLWTVVNNPGYGFTTNSLRYSYNSANAANVWFYTQGINLVAGTTYTIAFDYGGTGATYPERLKVAYGTSPSAASMTNAIVDYSNVVNNTPLNSSTEITPTVTGVYYFGFNAYSIADQFYLFVDNISVDESLSSSNFDTTNFKLYPNPVKDVVNLEYTSEMSSVSVYNLVGQQVLFRNINATTAKLDLSQLATGTYILNVTAGDTTNTIKVIKE